MFQKFNNTPFWFVRSVSLLEVISGLRHNDLIGSTQITDNKTLFERVKQFMYEVLHKVEPDDGHELLTNPGNGSRVLKDEKGIQIALKQWLRPMCERWNIDLNRENLTGRGELDFKFSIGNNLKCLLEVKLFHSPKLEHGLEIQLPTYLLAEKALFGIYVPIAFTSNSYEKKMEALERQIKVPNTKRGFTIEVIGINAWKPLSASKASTFDDPDRYCVD